MTSLGLIAAPNCRTGQSKGRYRAQAASIPVVVVASNPQDFTVHLHWLGFKCGASHSGKEEDSRVRKRERERASMYYRGD